MQAVQGVSALQGVAAVAVVVESRIAGDAALRVVAVRIEEAFQVVSPSIELVHLVEYEKRLLRNFLMDDSLSVCFNVPIEVAAIRWREHSRKCRLADLPRPADEHHLAGQVLKNLRFQIAVNAGHGRGPLDRNELFYTGVENSRFCF